MLLDQRNLKPNLFSEFPEYAQVLRTHHFPFCPFLKCATFSSKKIKVKCLFSFQLHRNYVETVVDNISYVYDDKYFL